jgi:pumilio family protein 6
MSKEFSENEFESDKSEQEIEENEKSTEEIEKQKIARKEQKEKTIERKLQKPNADLILSCKKIWDQLRRKELPKNERSDLMEQMMKLVVGKALEVIRD